MRGTVRGISPPRRLVIDLMRASMRVPFVSLKRTLDVGRLAEAREIAPARIGWAAIFAKAFCIVARDEPVLRTLYLKWPWPHFYELPRSVGMVAVARHDYGEDCILPQHVGTADALTLAQVDALIRHAQTAPIADVPSFRRIMRTTALWWPLRRLVWAFGLNVGRQRANYFGSFGITSVSAFGPGELQAISPGPYVVTYGALGPDRTMDVMIRWDHRLTDAAKIAGVLDQFEQVLNAAIVKELLADQPSCTPKPVVAAAT
jgi:hypothetical protein